MFDIIDMLILQTAWFSCELKISYKKIKTLTQLISKLNMHGI